MSKFIIEQCVVINGIMRHVKYIGEEVIGLITKENKVICFNIQDIKEVLFLDKVKQVQDYEINFGGKVYFLIKVFV